MVRPSPALVHRVQGVRWVRSAGRGSVGRAAPAPTCASSDTRSTAHARPLRPASIALIDVLDRRMERTKFVPALDNKNPQNPHFQNF
jgi:hypothetical protein